MKDPLRSFKGPRRTRRLALALASMSGLGACRPDAQGTESGPIGAASFDPSGLPAVTISEAEWAVSPRLSLSDPLGVRFRWSREESVADVVALDDGGLVFLSSQGALHLVSPRGDVTDTGLEFAGLGNPELQRWNTDTLLVVGRVACVRMTPRGVVLDTLDLGGRLLGRLADGSMVAEAWGRRNPIAGSPFETLAVEVTFHKVPPGGLASPGSRWPLVMAIGRHESLGRLYQARHLPWHAGTRGAVVDGRLWLSLVGGPELVEVSNEGRPVRLLRWEGGDEVTAEEAQAWVRDLRTASAQSGGQGSSGGEAGAQAVVDWYRRKEARAIDGMMPGSDGSLWVLKRRAYHATPGSEVDTWLGFTQSGEMIGTLTLPTRTRVFSIDRERVLLDLPGDSLPPLFYRLLPGRE